MIAGRITDSLILAYFVGTSTVNWTVNPTAKAFRAERRMQTCERQLRELHRGLQAYHRDHGDYPERLGMLYPKYVRDERTFTCPSALVRIREGRLGYPVQLGKRTVASAYLLSFLSQEHEAMRRWRGGVTPLVICDQHVQDVADETWGQSVQLRTAPRRHGDPPLIIARVNGRVDRLAWSAVRRRMSMSSNEL